jgi:glycosyltransferase involved in cell wall biosynthesis
MTDCERDAELAYAWGLRRSSPIHVIPGNFGVDLGRFPQPDPLLRYRFGLSPLPMVVYPRGLRGHVNYQGFVEAARILLGEGVEASFLGVGLAEAMATKDTVPGRLVFTKPVEYETILSIAASTNVVVSPAWSDGTPTSVLEGMAGGAIPVCGRLESMCELEGRGAMISWCDPSQPESIAAAMRLALDLSRNEANRSRNRSVVARHYSTSASAARAEQAYRDLAQVRVSPASAHHPTRTSA